MTLPCSGSHGNGAQVHLPQCRHIHPEGLTMPPPAPKAKRKRYTLAEALKRADEADRINPPVDVAGNVRPSPFLMLHEDSEPEGFEAKAAKLVRFLEANPGAEVAVNLDILTNPPKRWRNA